MIKNVSGNDYKVVRVPKTFGNNSYSFKQNVKLEKEDLSGMNFELSKGYYVSFGGLFKSKEDKIFEKLQDNFTPQTKREWEQAMEVANRYKHQEVTHDHLFLASLEDLDRYITDLNSNEKTYDSSTGYSLPAPLEYNVVSTIFKNEKERNKIAPIIKNEIEELSKKLEESDLPKGMLRKPQPSKKLLADLNYMYSVVRQSIDSDIFSDNILLGSILSSQEYDVVKMGEKFINKLQDATMIEKTPEKEKVHLKFYDDRADNLWKNMDLGNDMFVVYDNDNVDASKYLLNSFANLIKKPGQEYKNLNADNTNVIFFNENVNFEYLSKVVDKARKNPDKTTVLVVDFLEAMKNSAVANKEGKIILEQEDVDVMENKPLPNKPSNVRILLVANKDIYYANMASPTIKKAICNYGVHSLPILNASETRKILIESSDFVKKETKKNFKPNAISQSIAISNMQEGNFPEKTLKLMKNIAAYFVDEKEITLADVNKYMKDTKGLIKTNDSSGAFKVVFDTGKKLKDIVGNNMTKAEAASIVAQIKDKSIGTKGFIIYSNNGISGGGRKHTAEAIAGESGIPFLSINARDFALKDIDALSQNADLSELKIKRLVSMAKTQAEANKNKSAMIFIENFDNFGANPLTGISSIYEQKAFSQLLTEMENIRKNENINLVIVGSANYPQYIDEAIQKPYKFLDQIVVYSPQDKKDRIDVLNYYIKKNNLKIAGETPEEKNAAIKSIAETTAYFSVVNLMDLLDKAKIVSKERGHKAIDKTDFTEAFLRATSGRPSSRKNTEHGKAIVASHECGHSLILKVMYGIAKKQNIPWHLPDNVDFMTLDPRGNFGGCMFHKDSDNDEFVFEQVFTNMICSFGGHSCEKRFYNIDGSWGITSDMEHVASTAKLAVMHMGLGHKTGKLAISETPIGTIDVSDRVRNNIDDDIELLIKNANVVSDKIVDAYASYVEEFTEKYKGKVGTGECIIPSDEIQEGFDDWKSRQTPEKLQELDALEKEILDIIDKTKKGKLVNEPQVD